MSTKKTEFLKNFFIYIQNAILAAKTRVLAQYYLAQPQVEDATRHLFSLATECKWTILV
jgi:hypothetical protein